MYSCLWDGHIKETCYWSEMVAHEVVTALTVYVVHVFESNVTMIKMGWVHC